MERFFNNPLRHCMMLCLMIGVCLSSFAFAQKKTTPLTSETMLTGAAAAKKIPQASAMYFRQDGSTSLVVFSPKSLTFSGLSKSVSKSLGLTTTTFVQSKKNSESGRNHYVYEQHFGGIRIEGAEIRVHEEQGFVSSVNGRLWETFSAPQIINLTEEQAYQNALTVFGEEKEQVYFAPNVNDNVLVYHSTGFSFAQNSYRLTYRFAVYSHRDAQKAMCYYVDAETGEIIDSMPLVHQCFTHEHQYHALKTAAKEPVMDGGSKNVGLVSALGNGASLYNGTVSITTEAANGTYRLRGTTVNGGKVETYNAQNKTSTAGAVDFTDSDNNFTDVIHKAGVNAHFGAEKTYDYYRTMFNRNSIDNKGMLMKSYAHYGTIPYRNAFWNGIAMHYGDGDGETSSIRSFAALDVVGHEFTHGLTASEAGLVYSGESGALNESFSDIFGTMVEFYAQGGVGDWTLGEDIYANGGIIRSMSNPNLRGHPDTYYGKYWFTSTGDNGGVHYNSGVQNYWFYLLCNGGTVTNDFGNTFTVAAIGAQRAIQIVYHTLTNYLTSSSDYFDAKQQSELAAQTLFGSNSTEVLAVQNAWKAVGVDATQLKNTIVPVAQSATSITGTGFTGRWSRLGGTTYYLFDISTDKNFASFVSGYQNKSITGSAITTTITGLTAKSTYYYRLRAVNSYGTSPYSNVMMVTTGTTTTVLTAPVALAATNIQLTSFTANWSAVGGASYYMLDIAKDAGFTQKVLNNQALVGTTYTMFGLTAGTTYYYRVRAVNSTGTSAYSNVISVTTKTGTTPPTTLSAPVISASSISAAQFSLLWFAVQNATVYVLDVSLNSSFTQLVAGYSQKNVGGVTNTLVTGLSAGTTYYVRLRAYDGNNSTFSGYSNILTLTTTTNPAIILSASPQGFSVPAAGQNNLILTISANVAWTLTCNQSFVQLSQTAGNGNNTVTVAVAANIQSSIRQAVITLSGGGAMDNIIVTQAGAGGTTTSYSITGSIVFNGSGLSGVTVKTNTGLSAVTNSAGVYTISNVPAGTYSVAPVCSGAFAGYYANPGTKTVTVSGNVSGVNFGMGYVLASGMITLNGMPLKGVQVKAGALTTTSLDNGFYGFYKILPGTYTITPTLAGYTFMPTSRTITITNGDNGEGSLNFTATATGTGNTTPTLSGSPQGFLVVASGKSNVSLSVSSNITWTAAVDKSWVTLNKTSGIGNSIITFSVAPNTTTTKRTSVIALKGSGKLDNIVIEQAASTGFDTFDAEFINTTVSVRTYPNPFQQRINIHYIVPEQEIVSLKVYSLSGKEVVTLINGVRTAAGEHGIEWKPDMLEQGTYIYQLLIGTKEITGKIQYQK